MYDPFSADYDRFVDWPGRLAAELPFIERQLQGAGARRVLDAACGTGMHAVELARRGFQVVGTDLSAAMVTQARANAARAQVAAQFEVAGFGRLRQLAGPGFDALLCLGNSLPHVLSASELAATLDDFSACLRPGGLLMVQNRNFDALLSRRERWMEPQAHREEDSEWLFLRLYDFDPDGLITFSLVTLRRHGSRPWTQQVGSTRLRPLPQAELTAALAAAGFTEITCWGSMEGMGFDPDSSPDLVVAARRATWTVPGQERERGSEA